MTTIFKPYGIADGYAESAGMQMELFNNQITREQGVHSPRANYWTFPLYFLAENLHIPVTVLDFPSWGRFVRALKQGYTHVGFSFIQTNVMKVKRMAEYVRRRHPRMKILLGGYGTLLPDLDKLVPHDAVCTGEGIRWARRYFGEDPEAPVRHPIMHGVVGKRVYGWPTRTDNSAVLFPGLGCSNQCFFCATSAKFQGRYIPLLPDGKSLFETCREAEDKLGVNGFAIIDENFLKMPDRARELLAEMEAQGKPYNFALFSSAEVLRELGVDFLVRLGASVVWIGIESERPLFDKLARIDVRELIRNLQQHGISAITSSILFLEHHDRKALDEAIDWAIGMGGDYHQFMQLTPLAGTPLYEDYRRKGLLHAGFPYARMSGQDALNFAHPHFSSEEARELTRKAFRRYYHAGGAGVLKMARTFVVGYRRAREQAARRRAAGLRWNARTLRYNGEGPAEEDRFMALRLEAMRRRALDFRPILPAARLYAPNAAARRKAAETARLYAEEFGPPEPVLRVKQAVLIGSAGLEQTLILANRLLHRRDVIRNPPTRCLHYRMPPEIV